MTTTTDPTSTTTSTDPTTSDTTSTDPTDTTDSDPAAGDPLAALRACLDARLEPPARAWLQEALDQAHRAAHGPDGSRPHGPDGGRPAAWELRFAEAGRRLGGDQDAALRVRVLLLRAAGARDATAARLYHQGTAGERRAVLLALPHLGLDRAQGLALVHDALRANDTRLVAAAVGPYAGEHLAPHQWRHAVLKCLFTGVAVSAVARLAERARGDRELARMLGDYAAERTAAGRPVPDDVHHVLALAGA